ncbi:MAG: class F420-dependent oxidoreductase [Verrucomicrobiaceae bacterium]|nr:class F420-dependent oxidoreductase [Verrucomicrobiaceae bacterium]
MKINIGVPNSMHVAAMSQPWEYSLVGSDIANILEKADALGFYKCMLGEHFIVPNEHIGLSGDHYFHVAVALAFFAGHTKRMKLMSSVSILPLQNPIVQAKAWSTLDFLSGGRACALFGVGWLKEEFDMLGVNFHERGAMADEYIAAMIELWTKESPAYEGKYVSFKNIGFAPKPVQKPYLPIWFGGDAEPVLRRVARFGNGWSPFRTPPEKFPECIDYIRSQPEHNGRPLDIFFALEMLNVGAHHEILDDPRAPGNWDVQKIIDQIGWLKQLGVTETIVPLPKLDGLNSYMDRMQWVAEEIMPKVS